MKKILYPLLFLSTWLPQVSMAGGTGAGAGLPDNTLEESGLFAEARALSGQCGILRNDANSSQVIHNPELLENHFPFRKTMNRIISTAGLRGEINAGQVSRSLLRLFDKTEVKKGGISFSLDRRVGERDLNIQNFVQSMKPIALFNRIDLAQDDKKASCGEQRIVYALDTSKMAELGSSTSGRFFMIFEADYPNPNKDLGINGCLPVAEFWADMADTRLSNANRMQQLKKFFYGEGGNITRSGVELRPAVNWSAYKGGNRGQIRTNHFINFENWQLRDFITNRTKKNGRTELNIVVDRTDNSALPNYYADQAWPIVSERNKFNHNRVKFRRNFLNHQLDKLVASDSTDPNDISIKIPNYASDFQSDAGNGASQPSANVDLNGEFAQKIENELETKTGSLTVENILDRAGTQTCGGCHELSNGANLGGQMFWPKSLDFVHVDEHGNLSTALTETFLPARKTAMRNFLGCI